MQNNLKTSYSSEIDNLINAAKQALAAGDNQSAADYANKVIQKQPDHLNALEIMAMVMINIGNIDTAVKISELICKAYPNNANSFYNLANLYLKLERHKDALEYVNKAIAINPDNYQYNFTAGNLYYKLGNFDEATKHYEKSYNLNQNFLDPLEAICDIGDRIIFPKYLKLYYEKTRNPILKICLETHFPAFFNSQEEINNELNILNANLDKLIEENFTIDKLPEKFYTSIFYVAYTNTNNRELKKKFSKLFRAKFPQLNYISEHCKNKKSSQKNSKVEDLKIKVGFISNNLHSEHPVAQCFNGTIENLAKQEGVEVSVFFITGDINHHANDKTIQQLKNSAHKFIPVKKDIEDCRSKIEAEELDYLIYTDLGMFWFTYMLAHMRLAKHQCIMTGHPETSGIDTVDYYLSAKNLDADDAQEFYSEKLVLFENMTTRMKHPALPEKFLSRKELELPEGKNIYYCPMKNQKLHPDFDLAIKRILELDNNALIMFPTDTSELSKMVSERLKKVIGKENESKIYFHPWADAKRFVSYLNVCDVMLDSFPFGAGTTTYFAFEVSTPIITYPTKTGINRVTYVCYNQMGFDFSDLVATSIEDYAQKAVKLATDKNLNKKYRDLIETNKSSIYEREGIAKEMAEFLTKNK